MDPGLSQKSIVEFFFGVQRRLTNIERWNTTPRINVETVASHSYFVTLYAVMISDWLSKKYSLKIDLEKVVKGALLHDIEESFSGDIVASLKRLDNKFKDRLELICEKVVTKIFYGLDFAKEYCDIWRNTRKPNCLEYQIVLVSDIICQILYSYEELCMGNEFMKELCTNNVQRLLECGNEWTTDLYQGIKEFVSSKIEKKES